MASSLDSLGPPPGLEVMLALEKPLQRLYHHQHLPKPTDLSSCYGSSDVVAPTTIMIRNVPNRYTRNMLLTELEELGFAGTFDFVYLPVDRGNWRRRNSAGERRGKKTALPSVGYAFINFIDAAVAQSFMEVMQGYQFSGTESNRTALVSVAHIQGLEANLAHYENAVVNTKGQRQRDGPILIPALAPRLPR